MNKIDDQQQRHAATLAFFESVKQLVDEIEGEKLAQERLEAEWRSRCTLGHIDDESPVDEA